MRAQQAKHNTNREVPHESAGAKPRIPETVSDDLVIAIGGYRIASISLRSIAHPTLASARVLIAIGRSLEEDCLSNTGRPS